jgi:hypothetical protein
MLNDQNYLKIVNDLETEAAFRLQAAKADPDSLREAILWYLREGYRLGLCQSELIDFLCISTPNIVESAGYADARADSIVALFDELHGQLVQKK